MKKILVCLILSSALITPLFAAEGDTTFQKTNPNLLYTTKDFYIEVPTNCYNGNVCVKDFFLILTFNVGINGNNEIKQIGFKDADIEFYSKTTTGKTYLKQTFTKYEHVSAENGWNVTVIFYPDKPAGSASLAVNKFEFNGNVKQNHISGTLTFHTAQGQTVVTLN